MRTSRTIQRIAYDRWVRSLGLILLIGACAPSGLTIEVVVDDPALVKVELYAGASCGSECPRVTVPPGLPPMGVDDAFVVADPKPFIVERKDFADGVAGFRLESPTGTTLDILAAVGYDAQGQIKASWSRQHVEIPDGDAAHWRILLEPTTAIGTLATPQPDGTVRAAQWTNPSGGPACLLLERWGSNFVPTRELLGPENDRDCDGVNELIECAPWIPNAIGAAPTLDEARCVTPSLLSNGATVCMLGGPECTENPTLPHEQCVPTDPAYCAPQVLCACKGSLEPAMCIRDQLMTGVSTGVMPHVKCVVHVDASGARCDGREIELDAGAILSGSSAKCKGLAFNDADMGIAFNYAWHVGEGKLYIESFTQPCKATVNWEGGTAPLLNIGLMDAEIDNGYHLLLPVRLEIKPGCTDTAASLCTIVPSTTTETMFECTGLDPVMAGACAPNPEVLCNEGPMCNGVCCGPGEVCGPNGCNCNTGPACFDGNTCQNGANDPTRCGELCCGGTILCPF
jgi:hypothetical protein